MYFAWELAAVRIIMVSWLARCPQGCLSSNFCCSKSEKQKIHSANQNTVNTLIWFWQVDCVADYQSQQSSRNPSKPQSRKMIIVVVCSLVSHASLAFPWCDHNISQKFKKFWLARYSTTFHQQKEAHSSDKCNDLRNTLIKKFQNLLNVSWCEVTSSHNN